MLWKNPPIGIQFLLQAGIFSLFLMLDWQRHFQNFSVALHPKYQCPYFDSGLIRTAVTYYRLKSHSKSLRFELYSNPGKIAITHLILHPLFFLKLFATCVELLLSDFFYMLLPLDWNDFSSVCSKTDLKSGPRGSRKVDPLSYSVIVCFFTCNILFLSQSVI